MTRMSILGAQMSDTSAMPLAPALEGASFELPTDRAGRVHCYDRAGPVAGAGRELPPALLVHSVNAAASAFEVRPIYEHLGRTRPTYALDLPGFGLSERSARAYTPRLMTDAILALVDEIRRRHGGSSVDALALSLSCEFLARAATEARQAFRTLALVSPTGLDGTRREGPAGSTRAVPCLERLLRAGPGPWLFRQLRRPGVVRYFLERTWGSPKIDEELWAYDVATARQPGAEYAPLAFLAGGLFSNDVSRLYESLEVPVWVSHGVRGDFVDYRGASLLASRAGWRVETFATGALPHFEVPDAFFAAYERFLATLPSDRIR